MILRKIILQKISKQNLICMERGWNLKYYNNVWIILKEYLIEKNVLGKHMPLQKIEIGKG